jgi:hypothetical protein
MLTREMYIRHIFLYYELYGWAKDEKDKRQKMKDEGPALKIILLYY